MTGQFLTLEGIDGAGKSTHVDFIRDWLTARGIDVVVTREPGGTPLGEALRALLLDVKSDISLDTETLLMFAARQAHVDAVIRPALAAGRWVLSDRFTDATFAYQGGGRGVPFERIAELERWVLRDLRVDRTFLFDIPPDVARARMSTTRTLDRFEREREAFHQRVRNAYLSRAEADIDRIRVLDAELPVATLQAELARDLGRLLERR
ncbi:dTMP kinase [Microvirgula curvata]|uniref:Thymidylate kinase n=1 Tax=Microvirgula aerodenitrificans TaxID=57480 RepID=A0A2S0P774_9NEIS|nr:MULTISPECIES: dTMP kinase [Microvirgula]AVY93153.1 dTMP kinase [Microvirgula aerodenitrificans]RAS19641.1 thymidylate kinase [Microvirgula sp. AG722]